MINFRFHLISLVAVFLALGIGVAMGASFVDRATVDSLRGRVDALEDNYRRRGVELDATKAKLASSDNQAAALAGADSRALADRLVDATVVVINTESVDDDVLGATRDSLAASGARLAGSVTLQSSFLAPSKADLSAARQRLGIKGDGAEVISRIAGDLGIALGLLAASPPDAIVTTTTTTTTTVTGTSATISPPTDEITARAYIEALVDLGMLNVANGVAAPGIRFPDGSDYRYVLAVGLDDDPATAIEPLVASVGRQAPATMIVAEARSSRGPGEVTTTTEGQPARGATLTAMRRGETAEQVSTVDDLEEAFGRIAVVYAIVEQRDLGRVGHYGTGKGTSAPFPTVPTR